jgi:two-component system response regulator
MSPKIILLLEDNPDDEFLAMRSLVGMDLSFDVVVRRDGEAALRWLEGIGSERGGPEERLPDLILLDLKMPKVNGIDVLRGIRSSPRARYVPVVVFTSSSEERDVLESYEHGANSYVRKPVDFKQFNDVLRSVTTYWLSMNTTPSQ